MEKSQTKSPTPTQNQLTHQSQIWEDTSYHNPNLHTINVKIYLPKDIINATTYLINSRKQKVKAIETKESSQEFQQLKEKSEAYRKLDGRTQDEERRKNSELYRAYIQMQYHNIQREKYNVSLFEGFEDRGKCSSIKFSHRKSRQGNVNSLQLRLNKHYVLQELKLNRTGIMGLPLSFVNIWESDLVTMVKIIYKLSYDTEKSLYYNLFIRSLDLISITFDVQYSDKRIYRFRYSPFEFRSTLFFKDNHYLSGYNQMISLIPDISSIKTTVLDQEFYSAPRYFIFDDLTDQNMAVKIFQRTNIFYIAYSISRGMTIFYPGPPIDADEYCKKCLWYLYFSTTRLKKFIYTWSFRPFKKNSIRQEQFIREIELPSKQVILHIAFYIEVKDGKELLKDDPLYKVRVQYHETTREMPLHIKQQIIQRTKDWYYHFRELTANRDINKEKQYLEQERIAQLTKRTKEGQREREPEKPDRQPNELEILITSRDRFDRFLVGFLVIVSTIIDRNYFTMVEEKQLREPKGLDDNKIVTIQTSQIPYEKDKHGHWIYFHWLEIQFEHKILPHLFHSKDQKQRYHSHGGHSSKLHELRIKCGEWRLNRILKWKRQWNKKYKKGTTQSKPQEVLSLPEIFRIYVDILVRHFPLRYIYKDVISFILSMLKICYLGWEDSNDLHLNTKHEYIFVPIITAILSLYYFAPLAAYKEKDQRTREKMASQQSHSDRQERLPEQQRAKRDDRLIDQFSKVVVLKILTKGDAGFMGEDRLLGEVTFRLMDFKMCWITRLRQGVIMLRIFEDRIEFEKEYEKVQVLKFQQKGKTMGIDEISVRQVLQKLSLDSRPPLIL